VVFHADVPLTFVKANVTCRVFQRPAHMDHLLDFRRQVGRGQKGQGQIREGA
jgi:hypothetical protein